MPPIIQTREQLKSYIFRQLGSPVVNVEITTEQMDDIINDTVQLFCQSGYSGVEERYLFIPFTENVQDYILDYGVQAVLDVVDTESDLFVGGSASSDLWGANTYIAQQVFNQAGVSKIDCLTYYLQDSFIATLNVLFSRKVTFDFNCISKRLHLFAMPHQTKGKIVHLYRTITDVEGEGSGAETTNIYDFPWIKRMCIAKSKYMWGWNLTKYQGSVLPNGMTLNGEGIKTDGQTEITALMEELDNRYSLPPDFFVG